MSTPTNWPDPKRPGVPMFPERDGWHMLDRDVWQWSAKRKAWNDTVLHPNFVLPKNMAWRKYYGPVFSPAQINEMLAAERAKERERIIAALDNSAKAAADDFTPMQHGALMSITLDIIEGIRALGDAS